MFPAKRKKRTLSEGKALVEEFLRSGLKAVRFCEQKKIGQYVLRRWQDKFRNEVHLPKVNPNSFLPVQLIPAAPALIQTQPSIKVHVARGLIVEISSGFDKEMLKAVLEVCQSCG